MEKYSTAKVNSAYFKNIREKYYFDIARKTNIIVHIYVLYSLCTIVSI